MSAPPLARVLAAVFAALALAGALAALGVLPAAVLPWTAGPVVLAGAAWPLLVRLAPDEPSPLKLVVLTVALSAPLVAALSALAALALAPPHAFALALGLAALAQLLAPARGLRRERLGWAAWGAVGLALIGGAALAWLLFARGNAPRLTHAGVAWHAGVAQAFGRGWPLENPWLAGEPLPSHPGYDVLLATLARAFGLAPTRAAAALAATSAALVPLALYLFAAPLWREPRRAFLAPLLALVGWNALGGLRAPLAAEPLAWAADLARLTPGAGPGWVRYGLSSFFQPGPWAPGLALATLAWFAAAHALRHGRSPWPLLAGLLHGAGLLVAPSLGLAALGATLLAAALASTPARARVITLAACVACALPGAWLLARHGLATEPVRPHGPEPGGLAWLGPAALLLACALGLLVAHAGARRDPERGALLVLAACAVLVPASAPSLGLGTRLEQPELFRLAGLALGVLAAGGLLELWERRRAARIVATLLGVASLAGGGHALAHALRAHRAFAGESVPVTDAGGVLSPLPRAGGDAGARAERARDLAAAYAWLRTDATARAGHAVLVRSVALDSGRVGGPFAPHFGALYADLPMGCDRRVELSPESAVWAPRHDRVHALYRDRDDWDPRFLAVFEPLGRPLLFVVEETDRLRTVRGGPPPVFRGVDDRLLRAGCERVHVAGSVALYRWNNEARPR